MTKQEAAIKYITENYLEFNRLRHDIVSDKLQIRMEADLESSTTQGASVQRSKAAVQNGSELWREMTKHDINSIVCHCAQEYDANITSREVMTALQSDLIPDVHPLREYINALPAWKPESGDWIDFVASQVRVKNNDNKVSGNNNDNTDNLRPNQYPLGAQGEENTQQPKQLDSTTFQSTPFAHEAHRGPRCSQQHSERLGEAYKNDNIDNFRGNQYPCRDEDDLNQQLKQLDSTTYSARNNTASGEGNNTTPDRPRGLSERTSCCQTTTLLDRPYGAERPMNLTGEADLTVSEAHDLTSNSSQRERSEAERLWRVCFKKWFVAMVASWMKDEVVNHQVLVLIGKQGIFKTTWLEHLIPPHLRAYACKLANSNDLNKDERLRIAEFGLISLDEIDSMNNRELNQLKSVITATDVNERAAYAYTKERRVRLASFCASGNRRDFLTDITGNRRWLPFEVESIQNPFYSILPYEQMYAQAWALAQDPMFSYWFDLDEIEVLEEHNQHFRDESNEEQLLPILFDVPAEGRGEFMTTAQISERLVSYGNIKKPMALSRLGMVLGGIGYRAVTRKINNTRARGWIVYQRDTEEINSLKRLLKDG